MDTNSGVTNLLMALHCIYAAFLHFLIANAHDAGVELELHCCTIMLAVVMVKFILAIWLMNCSSSFDYAIFGYMIFFMLFFYHFAYSQK